jgi:hypothetical protein
MVIQQWEYKMVTKDIMQDKGILYYSNPELIWTEKDKNGISLWDDIKRYGIEGWELIAITPIIEPGANSAYTGKLLFTFKRPLSKGPAITP